MEKFLTSIFFNTTKKKVIFNSSKTMRFETTPKFLFSYEDKIAEITDDEEIFIYPKKVSKTTSRQINQVINFLKKNNCNYEIINFVEDTSL